MNEQRMIEMEKRIAFLDNTVDELTEALNVQQKQVSELQSRLQGLTDQLNSGNLVKPIEEEEKPPHY